MKAVLRFLKKHYGQPLAQGLDLDSYEALAAHRRIIRENRLLERYYVSMYRFFRDVDASLGHVGLPSLEIGSGAGFLKEFLPEVITSDVVAAEGIDRVEDACRLGFADSSLKAVYANGVLHHVSDAACCLSEVERVLAPGGVFVLNEPSTTALGYFMNRHFHHEPTDKRASGWDVAPTRPGSGRLTGANMALPWIIFRRDANLFRERFPGLRIESIRYHDFLRYALSGGLSYRPLVPPFLYWIVDAAEVLFKPLMFLVGQEMIVVIRKVNSK